MTWKTIKNNKAFSIMGVLVASVIGLIVMMGLSKLFLHMSSQITLLEQRTKQITLTGLLGDLMNVPSYCTATLKDVPTVPPLLLAGTSAEFYKLKGRNNSTFLDLTSSSHLDKYGISGYSYFKVKCDQTSCNCSTATTFPCTQAWTLTLVSQTTINNIPSFNRIVAIPFATAYNSTTATDFGCQ